ncbi:TPA: DNA cytosine methyltransferase [Enterobacter kobei]|nr:DNA cytosine methyltransferase [Enterobacter kobei]
MNKPVSYGSVCSGIEAASVAWHCLGWQPAWFAEIEKFPSAVLAYRWPEVSNLGDMTQIAAAIRAGKIEAPDVLVGGTPCQAFSVAGLRNGLADERGQLTLAFVELVNAIDEKRREQGKSPVIVVWENVPGVFSSKDNAFGCFLAGLAGESCALESPGKRWSNAGYVLGPERAIAWRVLDAQFFGVAQRRRRVFIVATARGDIDPAKILFESEGLRRNSPPRRETTEIVAALTARGVGTCGADDNQAQAGHLQAVVGTIAAHSFTGGAGGRPEGAAAGHYIPVGAFRMRAFGEYVNDGTGSTCKARDHKDATDLAVMSVHGTQDPDALENMAHTLGRNHGQENAVIAFSSKDSGHDAAVDISPTLRAGNSYASNQNAGSPPAVAYADVEVFAAPAIGQFRADEISSTLTKSAGQGNGETQNGAFVMKNMAVRRLTPVECERLQGFPDNHTLIPTQKRKQLTAEEYAYLRHHRPELTAEQAYRLAADGPRYKAIGNSMAVPVMRWIGSRIQEALRA